MSEAATLFAQEGSTYLEELRSNRLVKEIEIIESTPTRITYSLVTLESRAMEVDLREGLGLLVRESGEHYETFEALLSSVSEGYRKAFAEKISMKLMERLGGALAQQSTT